MTKAHGETREQRFLSGLTHELRTPLGSILMLTELLGENRTGSMSAKDLSYVEKIRQAATDVRTLIDDVGLLNRIDADRITLSLTGVSLHGLLGKLESEGEDQPEVTVSRASDLPERLKTDGEILLRILKALLGEAQRASPEKAITLTVDLVGEKQLRFNVCDSGPSVPQDQQPALFEPFAAAGSRNRRRFGGQSLTLPIAKRLGRLLGGELCLRSGQSEGNIFELVLPIDCGSAELPVSRVASESG